MKIDDCRKAFEQRTVPNLDLKRRENGDYHYDVTCTAFRDFADGWQAAKAPATDQPVECVAAFDAWATTEGIDYAARTPYQIGWQAALSALEMRRPVDCPKCYKDAGIFIGCNCPPDAGIGAIQVAVQPDDCLTAFEEWMADKQLSTEKANGDVPPFKDRRVEAMWEGFVCAWGLRPTEREAQQPVELSDEEEDVWQIINDELAALNLIGKRRTDAADAIWERIRPYISEAVNVEKIAQMSSDRPLDQLPEDVRMRKLELARDAIAAMGFTPVHTEPEREAVTQWRLIDTAPEEVQEMARATVDSWEPPRSRYRLAFGAERVYALFICSNKNQPNYERTRWIEIPDALEAFSDIPRRGPVDND